MKKNKIKTLREEKNFTKEEFSEKLGISIEALNKIEKGKGNPSPFTLNKISKILNVDVLDLSAKNTEDNGKSKAIKLIIFFSVLIVSVFLLILLVVLPLVRRFSNNNDIYISYHRDYYKVVSVEETFGIEDKNGDQYYYDLALVEQAQIYDRFHKETTVDEIKPGFYVEAYFDKKNNGDEEINYINIIDDCPKEYNLYGIFIIPQEIKFEDSPYLVYQNSSVNSNDNFSYESEIFPKYHPSVICPDLYYAKNSTGYSRLLGSPSISTKRDYNDNLSEAIVSVSFDVYYPEIGIDVYAIDNSDLGYTLVESIDYPKKTTDFTVSVKGQHYNINSDDRIDYSKPSSFSIEYKLNIHFDAEVYEFIVLEYDEKEELIKRTKYTNYTVDMFRNVYHTFNENTKRYCIERTIASITDTTELIEATEDSTYRFSKFPAINGFFTEVTIEFSFS